jgi:hypothetical protein
MPPDPAAIRRLYGEGKTCTEMAKALGLSYWVVREACKKLGLELKRWAHRRYAAAARIDPLLTQAQDRRQAVTPPEEEPWGKEAPLRKPNQWTSRRESNEHVPCAEAPRRLSLGGQGGRTRTVARGVGVSLLGDCSLRIPGARCGSGSRPGAVTSPSVMPWVLTRSHSKRPSRQQNCTGADSRDDDLFVIISQNSPTLLF